MQWKLFADLREVTGDATVRVDVPADATVGDALDALLSAYPALEDRVTDESGDLREHINVLRNGEQVDVADGGLDARVSADDELALFPPVSGG